MERDATVSCLMVRSLRVKPLNILCKKLKFKGGPSPFFKLIRMQFTGFKYLEFIIIIIKGEIYWMVLIGDTFRSFSF